MIQIRERRSPAVLGLDTRATLFAAFDFERSVLAFDDANWVIGLELD